MAGPPEMCAWGMGKVPAQVAFLSPPPVGAPAGASAGAVEPGGGLAHSPPLQKLPPWRERRAPGGEREDRTPAHLCRAACCRSGTVPTSHLLEHPHLDPPWVSSPLARTPSSLRLCPHLVFGDRPRPGVPPQLHVLCCVSACSLTTVGTPSFLPRICGAPFFTWKSAPLSCTLPRAAVKADSQCREDVGKVGEASLRWTEGVPPPGSAGR